jgi:aminoglycoside/choline kinase family phosphotransferase
VSGAVIGDSAVHSFVGASLGPYRLVADRSWAHAESRVWEVRVGPAALYVKQHARPHKFEQEWRAYRDWVPALGSAAPRLIAAQPEPGVLILSALEGEIASTVNLDAAEEQALYERAGRLLRRLHALPHQDPDPQAVYLELRQKLGKWTALAPGLVDAGAVRWVAAEVETLLNTPGLTQVPCHNDFTPRNWLVKCSETGLQVGVIDFEHAGPGLWVQDFSRLWSQVWPERPDLETAFFSGYGSPLDAAALRMLTSLSALEALATVVWANRHGDHEFEALGRTVLARLGPG